jgi:hypothetical protein
VAKAERTWEENVRFFPNSMWGHVAGHLWIRSFSILVQRAIKIRSNPFDMN